MCVTYRATRMTASEVTGGERNPLSTHQASNRRHPSARRSRVSRSALRAAMLGRVSEAFGGAGGPGRLGTLALERRLSRMTCSCAKYGTHRPTYTHLRPGRFRESPERARPWCRCHGRRTPSSKTPETGRSVSAFEWTAFPKIGRSVGCRDEKLARTITPSWSTGVVRCDRAPRATAVPAASGRGEPS